MTRVNKKLQITRDIASLLVLVALIPLSSCNQQTTSNVERQQEIPHDAEVADGGTVFLRIEFPGARQSVEMQSRWTDDMTVFDLLKLASKRFENLSVDARGSGEMTLVNSIGEVKNTGAADQNWIYYVNQKVADRSCGKWLLDSGDEVLWTFGPYLQQTQNKPRQK